MLIVFSFLYIAIGVILAIYVFSRLPALLARIPASKYASVQPRDETHLFIMVAVLCLSAYLTSSEVGIIGSHLLGTLPQRPHPTHGTATSICRKAARTTLSFPCCLIPAVWLHARCTPPSGLLQRPHLAGSALD